MIKGMTGYGWAETQCRAGAVRAEVHSVNYKAFKFSPKLPDFLRYKEGELEKVARSCVQRGHLYLNVDVVLSDNTLEGLLDRARLQSYIRIVRDAVGDDVQVTADIAGLVGLPGVMDRDDLPDDMRDEIFRQTVGVLETALEKLDSMRRAEGEALYRHLQRLCRSMVDGIREIEQSLPEAIHAYRRTLQNKVDVLLEGADISLEGDVLSREVAIMAERCDVAEELERLENHTEQFCQTLDSSESGGGKKLEFLVQEMHREANTLGSKLPSSRLIHRALDIKSDVHQLREQVMNVE